MRITTAILHHNLAVAYEQGGDHAAAADAFTRTAELESILGRAKEVREEQKRAEQNREAADMAAEQHVLTRRASAAKARQAGKMAEALQHYLGARHYALRSGKPELVAQVAYDLSGVFFYQGEYGKARDIVAEALVNVDGDSRLALQLHIRMGTVLAALPDAAAAEREFTTALASARAKRLKAEIDQCEYGLSQLALNAGDYEAAETILRRVLKRRRRDARWLWLRPWRRATATIQLGNALNQLGFVAMRRGRPDESMRYHAEALAVRRGHDLRGSAESLHSLGYLYEHSGDARRALAHYARSVRSSESIRGAISTGAASRASHQELVGHAYLDAARLACALGRGALAWRLLQLMQNRTLVDSLARAPVERPPAVPPQLFETEADLLLRLHTVDADPLSSHDLLRQLATLYRGPLREAAPAYVRWRTGEPMQSGELLRTLTACGPGTAYVELVDLVHQGANTGWSADLFGVGARAGDRAIRALHASTPVHAMPPTAADTPAVAAGASRVMARIAEVLGGPGHLFVVLHGPLSNFPLHTIPIGDRPLVEWQPIRFLPHSGFLDAQRWLPRRPGSSAEVLGDSDDDLPSARAEAEHVARLLRVRPKLGSEVTRRAMAEALGTADLVHVASHAFFDSDSPTRSGLVTSDGVFTAEDVALVPIRASIVVLNACESGMHGAGMGNELYGFVRALLLGGVHHVVCTLEAVEDDVAREFAEELYDRLQSSDRADIVSAVWGAQRALARNNAASPDAWSPFILVG